MTRREFMASSSAFLAAHALGKGVDTKEVAVGCEIEPWWNPYPTDGLVAMYDAIWNVGLYQHSNSTLTLKDLSGNGYDLTVIKDGTRRIWEPNYFQVSLSGTGSDNQCMFYLDDEARSQELTSRIASVQVSFYDLQSGAHLYASTSIYRNAHNATKGFAGGNAQWIASGGAFSGTWTVNYSPKSLAYGDMNAEVWHNAERATISKLYATQKYECTKFSVGGAYGYDYNVSYSKFRFLRIYDRWLTDEEARWIYAVDKARFNLT